MTLDVKPSVCFCLYRNPESDRTDNRRKPGEGGAEGQTHYRGQGSGQPADGYLSADHLPLPASSAFSSAAKMMLKASCYCSVSIGLARGSELKPPNFYWKVLA